jgi:hypothetical protein
MKIHNGITPALGRFLWRQELVWRHSSGLHTWVAVSCFRKRYSGREAFR